MKNFNKPKFITFEGGEGSGKSTQSKKLYDYLLARGSKTIHTREVGGTKEAEEIRNILVHRDLYNISELMLVMAARYEHVNKLILPALLDGCIVVCDRFVDSTAAYQADNRISIKDIFKLHNKLVRANSSNKIIMPDITFFMDLEPETALQRSFKAGDINKFENKNITFHQEVYERFNIITSLYPNRIKPVKCQNKEIEKIHREVISYIFSS